MSLTAGTRLGPFDVLDLIGAGGMGEVYRARDTRLGRQVALKVLPTSVAVDSDRLSRLRREAQVLASLNHPNIAAIHGLEEAGDSCALVLELVEGPTLADRIAKGPIPLAEAVPLARQMTEALEAAHEQGSSATVVAQSLATGERRTLVEGTHPRYAQSGQLLFARGDVLWAVAFDADGLTLDGEPMPLVEGVRSEPRGAVQFQSPGLIDYDVHPDGRRFVVIQRRASPENAQIRIVQHWFQELAQRVPAR